MEPTAPAFDISNVVVSADGALAVLPRDMAAFASPSEIMMQPHCDAIRRDMIDHFIKYGFWDRDMIRRLHRARTERAERSSRSRSRSPTHGRNRSRSPRRRPTDAELAADAPKRTRCDRDSKGLGQRVSPVPLVPYP